MLVVPEAALAYEELSALLGGWEGFEIVAVRREPASALQPVPRVVIVLQPAPTRAKRCSRCDQDPSGLPRYSVMNPFFATAVSQREIARTLA